MQSSIFLGKTKKRDIFFSNTLDTIAVLHSRNDTNYIYTSRVIRRSASIILDTDSIGTILWIARYFPR